MKHFPPAGTELRRGVGEVEKDVIITFLQMIIVDTIMIRPTKYSRMKYLQILVVKVFVVQGNKSIRLAWKDSIYQRSKKLNGKGLS